MNYETINFSLATGSVRRIHQRALPGRGLLAGGARGNDLGRRHPRCRLDATRRVLSLVWRTGEAGARLCRKQAMPVCAATLLAQLRRAGVMNSPPLVCSAWMIGDFNRSTPL